MKRKSLFLLFLLIMVIMPVVFIPNVYAIDYIFEDGFEVSYEWDEYDPTGHNNERQGVVVYEGSWALEIKKLFSLHPNARIYDTFINQTDKVLIVQFAIRRSGNNGFANWIYLSNSTLGITDSYCIYIGTYANQFIYWYDDTGSHSLQSYAMDTWYNITLKIYQNSGFMKIWINDVLRESSALARGSPTNLDRIVVWNADNGVTEKLFLDSVLLWEGSGIDFESIEIIDRSKTDLEDWIFAENTYIFNATVIYEPPYQPYEITIGFQDFNDNWLNATVDLINRTYTYSADNDIGYLSKYENSSSGNYVFVIFHIYLSDSIIDTEDIDLYGYASATEGLPFAFQIIEVNYCNIYNLGGLTSIETSGTASRIVGGQILELQAGNPSDGTGTHWIRLNQTWKNLRHIHLLPYLDPRYGSGDSEPQKGGDWEAYYNTGYWEFGIDYVINEVWIKGWSVRLNLTYYNNYYANEFQLEVTWFNRGTKIRQDNMSGSWENANSTEGYSRFWVDLWFGRENASSVVEGRVGSYYKAWQGNFFPWDGGYPANVPFQSLFGDTLRDVNNNKVSATNITLMNFWVKVLRDDYYKNTIHVYRISDVDAINYVANDKTMVGVDEPIFIEPKDPETYNWGFFEPLRQIFTGIGRVLSDAFSWVMIQAVNALSSVGNTVFSWFGLGDTFFTDIMQSVGRFFDSMIASIGIFVSTDIALLFLNIINAIGLVLSGVLNILIVLVTSFVTIIPIPLQLVSGFLTYMGDFWNGTGAFTGFAFKDFSTIFALAITFGIVISCVKTGSINPLMKIINTLMGILKIIYWMFNFILRFMLFIATTIRKLIPI